MQEGSRARDQMIRPASFRLPSSTPQGKDASASRFFGGQVPRNTDSETGRRGKRRACDQAAHHLGHLELALAGTVSDSAELPSQFSCPAGDRAGAWVRRAPAGFVEDWPEEQRTVEAMHASAHLLREHL